MENPIPTIICLFALSICTITVNVLALIVYIKSSKHGRGRIYPSKPPVMSRTTDYHLLSLIVVSIVQGAVTIPAYALKKWDPFDKYGKTVICDIFRFFYFTCTHISVFSLLGSSMNRAIGLVYPFRFRRQFKNKRLNDLSIFLIWMISIGFDTVPFFPVDRSDSDGCHYVPCQIWAVTNHIVGNIVPLVLLIIAYIIMVKAAYGFSKRKISPTSTADSGSIQTLLHLKATRIGLLITGSYFICWGPACIYYLLDWLCKSCFTVEYKPHDQWVRNFVKIFVLTGNLISPIIFCWGNRAFRHKAKTIYISSQAKCKKV